MKRFLSLIFFSILQFSALTRLESFERVVYPLTNEPVDVVFPTAAKDIVTLDLAIEGIKKNCKNLRRVIVVSSERLTDNAEWFDEKYYPFTKYDVALYLNQMDEARATKYMNRYHSRVGWYFAQLLKMYAVIVIPGISSNAVIIDSDTIFMNPVEFVQENGDGLYNPGTEYVHSYFTHMEKLLPGLRKVFPHLSGISHHLLFQRPILEDLFAQVKKHHNLEFWQAYCLAVDQKDLEASGAADYEIYFNFAFDRTDQVHLRYLKWQNSNRPDLRFHFECEGYHYVSFHYWSIFAW